MSDSMIDLKNEWVNLLQSAKRVFQQISTEKNKCDLLFNRNKTVDALLLE